jgi:cyclohexanone monooxygenase
MGQSDHDVLIVGAGFGGIYQLKSLLDLGLNCKVIDMAGDVGGTWYWNRYPGAMSDTESYIYRFSWDNDDLQNYPWPEHYVKQPEVLKYLEHLVERHDLRKHMQFNTELQSADWSDEKGRWVVQVSTGETITARYMVTALGLLSKTNYPDWPGIQSFKGEMYHTGQFPKDYDFSSKRVGVIGCGSTGVQVITELGKHGKVKQLLCFQRHPQYSVPSGDGPVSPDYRASVNSRYEDIWKQVKNSIVAFGFEESKIPAMSVSPEERERVFQDAWDKSNGFRFMFATFCDITYNREANEAACDFVRSKIAEIVKDPEKRRKLTPHDYYARRPLCDGGYYQVFNSPNVDIVDMKETPVVEVTPTGIKTSDGTHHDLDVIIWATGFDAVDGNYTGVKIRGRNGENLKEHWADGPTSYLGVCVSKFPNMFMITGPNGPFTNIPPTIETHVEFIADAIKHGEDSKHIVEATREAEDGWTQLCKELSDASLFKQTDSWIFGANVKGKTHTVMFFFGGLQNYRERLAEIISSGYKGFKPLMTT